MEINLIKEIKSKLFRKLHNSHGFKGNLMLQELLDKEINSPFFLYELQAIIEEKNFSASAVLCLSLPLLKKLSPVEPEDWLYYLYNYALSKNFKDAVSIDLKPELNLSCEVFFKIFKVMCEYEKLIGNMNIWQTKYPLYLLSEEEINNLERKDEYSRFLRGFQKDYVYEMMKLNGELFNYNTLDHVCGVHFLAMFLARQLLEIKIPIDLGRVSGAAAGHDIGKYGCKGAELRRVPHLHYYYTDEWFKKHNINYIRNIAVNHSVWDLELENLSLEALILIYCDFRVKNAPNSNGNGAEMHIYTLKDSFDVILEKLENVDAQKENRYRRVYEKLKDFEDFLHSINICTDPHCTTKNTKKLQSPAYALLSGPQITSSMKNLTINHNINLMYLLRDEYSLNAILEQGRSETNWENLRQYIRVLDEYSTYFTQNQKLQTLDFLFELLTHEEDDIRRHCSTLIGRLIAVFDQTYGKELPKDVRIHEPVNTSYTLFAQYLNAMLYPSNKLIPVHKRWIGFNAKTMVASLFENISKANLKAYRDIVTNFYSIDNVGTFETQLYLLDTVKFISYEGFDSSALPLINFILMEVKKRNTEIRISALEALAEVIPKLPPEANCIDLIKTSLAKTTAKSKLPSENYLLKNIFKVLNMEDQELIYENYYIEDFNNVPDIFLSNLKSATSWILKKHQVDILLEYTLNTAPNTGLHTCIHFCNMLKVSEFETVRNKSGYSILKIMPILNASERNEVAIELLRGLEMDGQKFTEYIPPFLGRILLWLEPNELDEILDDLRAKIKNSRENVKILILKTIGVTISNYFLYENRFKEGRETYETRLKIMLSILLNGVGNYNSMVKEAAIITLGKDILGSKVLSLEEKLNIFKLTAKKLLTLISDDEKNRLLLLTNAATLNHIYRFISNYKFYCGEIEIDVPKKVAFFPGTFDPFSLGHKYIAKIIRDLGYEVYLAVDEFSWSKKTLPNLLRRILINLSICDEFNIYLYPESQQVNIGNPKDLQKMRESFNGIEVYFVSGSDVLLNASCYKSTEEENSIHTFPHIIFERGNTKKLQEAKALISGKVEVFTLPPNYSLISSSQIRSYIDKNRDISALVDPLVSQYIMENGFYQREPLDKLFTGAINFDFKFFEFISDELIALIKSHINVKEVDLLISSLSKKEAPKMVLIQDTATKDIIALSGMHWVRNNNLFHEVKDEAISSSLRQFSLGRIMLLDGIYINPKYKHNDMEQIILTETLAFAISKDYEYALFKPLCEELSNQALVETMTATGFKEIQTTSSFPVLMVNMTRPCILNLDIENIIKEPFRNNPKVKSVINTGRKRLQKAFMSLYPKDLLLCFNSQVLHQRMIKNICSENKVPTEILEPKAYGEAMCVPYGDILDRYVVPNTVTKSLHTEKYYNGEMSSFFIGQSPYYLTLRDQIKMIKSFNRPIFLVDNILHKGYRMKALDPLLNKEGVKVKKILCGILSGRGKDLMDMQNREVTSVYFIPRLRLWFNENAMYPFLGGDAIWRGDFPKRNLIPSINALLPYTYPVFIKDVTNHEVYNLSKICLENSIEILKVLEMEYHNLTNRTLTLHSLGEVITTPRSPDIGRGIEYDLSSRPSALVEKDLELLSRLANIL